MNSSPINILVFKTNICTKADCSAVKELFDTISSIIEWNIDTEDIDRVLRIVTQLGQADVISIVNKLGYACSELE